METIWWCYERTKNKEHQGNKPTKHLSKYKRPNSEGQQVSRTFTKSEVNQCSPENKTSHSPHATSLNKWSEPQLNFFIIRLGLNVALTHKNMSYRDSEPGNWILRFYKHLILIHFIPARLIILFLSRPTSHMVDFLAFFYCHTIHSNYTVVGSF